MVCKSFTIPFHAVILFFVIIDILYIVIDVLLNLPAEFLAGIILDCIQQVADTKGVRSFPSFIFNTCGILFTP